MKKLLFIVPFLLLLASCTDSSKIGVNPTSWETKSATTANNTIPKENRTIPTPTYWSGKNTLEIFADFQCPACISFSKGVWLIMEDYAKQWKLTITYRQFPLTGIHKNAYRDALAVLCGGEQGKYMETKKALYAMEEKKAWGKVSDSDRMTILGDAGLDTSLLGKCLASEAFKGQVDADMARGESVGVNGTPTLLLNGIKLDMSLFRDTEGLKSFLDKTLNQ